METSVPLNEDQKIRRKMGRIIGWAVWQQEYKTAHPDAEEEAIQVAWNDARENQTKLGMRALRSLEAHGYTFAESAE